ncbi:MAG: nuclease A inhibitor family protein [Oscillatoria princeps RMCB-10]|jgi:hypothetical protein|nr:nuclease A inhibitor family protein [Oscillatoria princeps RMCB-10]
MIAINSSLTDKLADLTDGLFWISKKDFYPFQVFAWETAAITPRQLLQLSHHPQNTPVEVVDFDELFAPALQQRDEQTEKEKATVGRYHILKNFLKYHLSHIKVYRVGTGKVDIYIIGTTRDDNLAGLSTVAVEA